MHRWIGIDEAGYGPNLGPMVMAAVIAESVDERPPDLWKDLSRKVSRAGGPANRLWVDDSKEILKGGKGRDRLVQTAVATLLAAGLPVPSTLSRWLASVDGGTFDDVELTPWLEPGNDPVVFVQSHKPNALACDHWRIVSVRAVIVGPKQFNTDIDETDSKAAAHFRAFTRLIRPIWDSLDAPALAVCDKHGGRNFYLEPLYNAFPEIWIDRGEEGADLSTYTLREGPKRLHLQFRPRADGESGLVALASITAKAIREAWMDAFNYYWKQHLPDLKPTAGYSLDAHRFRRDIEAVVATLDLEPSMWWRHR